MRRLPTALLLALALPAIAACAGRAPNPNKEILTRASGSAPLYSPAVRAGDLVFLAGAIGTRPGGGLVQGGIQAETRQVMENIRATLRSSGLDMQDIVKCSVFLADIRDYDAMNEVYGQSFDRDPPARTAVGVSGLPFGARVEIECIAATR